jgi:hypothetical protein
MIMLRKEHSLMTQHPVTGEAKPELLKVRDNTGIAICRRYEAYITDLLFIGEKVRHQRKDQPKEHRWNLASAAPPKHR